MKKLKFLTVAILATSMFACTSEQKASDGPDNNRGLEGYLTLNISQPSTRTSGTDIEAGLTAESTISNVTVVFTNAAGVIQDFLTPTIAAGVTEKFQVALGTYSVYALINKPASVVLAKGENIERAISVASTTEATTGFGSGGFFMVNERNSGSANAGVSVTIAAGNTEANPATASVKVDRVAAKVEYTASTPTYTATHFPSNITALDIVGFARLNMNKSYNLVQKWSTVNKNGALATLATEVLETPLYTENGTNLVKDQYFNNISEFTSITKTGADITAITDNTKGSTTTYSTDTFYTTENRPTIMFWGSPAVQLTAGRGESTGVIYKVQAKDGAAAAATFYNYNGIFYANLAAIQALPDFDGVTLNTLTIPQLRAKAIQVYEDGVMYYTYFILDPNPAHQYTAKNYYGVMRNSTYKLAVNSFTSIGDDVPGGGSVDPDQPGEPGNPPINVDKAYIKVAVTVNPWIINTIGIDF